MPTVRYTTVNSEVLAEKRGGVRRFYVPDPLDSTVALLDSSQTKTDTFTYWPYGEVKTRTGTTATPLQFVGTQGYYQDRVSRIYVRARHLRVDHGRWLTEDPIGFRGWSENLYEYVNGRPMIGTDASGREYYVAPCPSAVPGVPQNLPSGAWLRACKRCGGKAVYLTCFDQTHDQCKENNEHAAVYCRDNDWIDDPRKGKPCHPNEACDDYDKGRVGQPVYNRGSQVCIWGMFGPQTLLIDDCGCGPRLPQKPINGFWMDICVDDCNRDWERKGDLPPVFWATGDVRVPRLTAGSVASGLCTRPE